MKVLSFLLLIAAGLAFPHHEEWEIFKASYGKKYATPIEEQNRLMIFLENKMTIEEHNEKYHSGLVTFSMEMNRFGDLSLEEFKSRMNGVKNAPTPTELTDLPPALLELPDSVDWRQQGAVTAVKDQGNCGACWAFSATGSLEGQLFINSSKLTDLSEQQLLDCSSDYGNTGCTGGFINQAFIYISANGGIDTEESYPYQASSGGSCKFDKGGVGATVTGVMNILHADEGALQSAVATAGPVSVSVDGGHQSFQFYSGGIYYESACNSSAIGHAALAVGYGSENGTDFWLVKNSWGTAWGEQGYIRMSRNKDNNCGIASVASYPKL